MKIHYIKKIRLSVLLALVFMAGFGESRAQFALNPNPKDSSVVKSVADSSNQQTLIRNHDHITQVVTGSVVMTCLALMLVTMNNYNPR